MKKLLIIVAAIFMLSISAYADYECDSKYQTTIIKVKSMTDVSDETKNKYISGLEKAHQLCNDGKKEQAAEILEELRKEKDFDAVFQAK
jgi:hypothetical protein